jgi:hypothetical protein
MAHAGSGDQVAGLFCQVLGLIAGSLEGFAYGHQVIAFADWLLFGILYMPEERPPMP